ncbi:MAG TPA: ThuA domain-containing protein [Rhizomicrobium sp.]|nr:ThuA domain-containing protein [Rhizomicrobium sp.]
MPFRTVFLAGVVLVAAMPAMAQTAKDYARYDTYVAPRPQGQNPAGLRVFLLGGLKSHGPGAHDYPFWLDKWSKLLTAHGAVVDGGFSFPGAAQLARTDVMVIYRGDAGYMTPQQRADLQAYVKRGGGLVTLHDSLCGPDPADMATLVGAGKKHGEVNYTWTATLDYTVADKDSPLIAGMPMQLYDEAFYKLDFAPEVKPILTVTIPDTPAARRGGGVGQVVPQMWTYEHTAPGGQAPARAFVWMQGHMIDNIEDPKIQAVMLRGIAWAGKRPVGELADYAPPKGAQH